MNRTPLLALAILIIALFPARTVSADVGSPESANILPFRQFLPTIQTASDLSPQAAASTPSIYLPLIQTGASQPPILHAIDDWVPVGVGIDYREYLLPDPNQVYVARMARDNPGATLESAVGSGELASGRETVSEMAGRYDEAINAWNNAWGNRNHVVVAINGDYFNPGDGYPQNGQIQAGWYIKRYNDYEGWSGFAWTSDRQAFIAACIINPPGEQFITYADGTTQPVDGINAPRQDGQLFLYTPQYAATTQTRGAGAEVVVRLKRPLAATPIGQPARGRVVAIRTDQGATPLAFDTVVLSATGQAEADLLARVNAGDEIGIAQEIQSVGYDCKTPIPGDWTQVYASVGGAFTFLRDGQRQHDDEIGAVARSPRTAIAFNDQYIYYIVVDGRNPGVSVGMSFDELAVFAQDTLGASWGIAQDGGGSSTMVINGQVVNTPSDKCKAGSASISNPSPGVAPDLDLVNPDGSAASTPDLVTCERPVSNGMLMVEMEPMEQSQTFTVGSAVTAPAGASLYLGPGTNYAVVDDVAPGEQGKILDDGHGLAGVLARGAHWWKVDFNGPVGWAMEQDLR